MYLPKETVQALDEACKDLPFNRSELANLAIREGLTRILVRLGRIPRLASQHTEKPLEVPPA